MINRFYKGNGELEDKKIISALYRATEDYDNGAIVEVRDLLAEIVCAIDAWIEEWEENNS